MKRTQIAVSLAAAVLAILHVAFPGIAIDAITVALLLVAIAPWLAPIVKAVELPGGTKIELRELNRIAAEAAQEGLLGPSSGLGFDQKSTAIPPETASKYSFLLVADQDPALALAGLRIEIEKRLSQIAFRLAVPTHVRGIGSLLRELERRNALSERASSVLRDIVGTLNRAAHGAEIDPRAAAWVIEIGPRLLDQLDAESSTGIFGPGHSAQLDFAHR